MVHFKSTDTLICKIQNGVCIVRLPEGNICESDHQPFTTDDKILALSKLKLFRRMLLRWCHFSLIRVDNIVGKGENAGYQHFFLFPQCFQKASFLRFLNSCSYLALCCEEFSSVTHISYLSNSIHKHHGISGFWLQLA